MGKICAAPTAGSCGILPAVIIGVSEHYGLSRKDTLNGLLTASGIGTVVINNATVSGAEVDVRQNVVLRRLWLQQPLYR